MLFEAISFAFTIQVSALLGFFTIHLPEYLPATIFIDHLLVYLFFKILIFVFCSTDSCKD